MNRSTRSRLARLLAQRSPEPAASDLAYAAASLLESEGSNALGLALTEGIAARDAVTDRVELAVTGMGWLGSGVPSVQRMLQELLTSAREEVQVTAYAITSGSEPILAALEELADSGVRCTLIVNEFLSQPADVRAVLRRIASAHSDSVRLLNFSAASSGEGLHAKVVVVDRRSALVGSSNLTFHGMVAAHELALVVRGPAAARIAARLDLLARSSAVEPVLL